MNTPDKKQIFDNTTKGICHICSEVISSDPQEIDLRRAF